MLLVSYCLLIAAYGYSEVGDSTSSSNNNKDKDGAAAVSNAALVQHPALTAIAAQALGMRQYIFMSYCISS